MTGYRFYLLGEDGKICRAEVVESPTDADALAEAESRLAGCGYPAIEVWDPARRIGGVGRLNNSLEMTAQDRRAGIDPSWLQV